MATVVVPAHNEAAVIDTCLQTLLDTAEPDEFDVVVACNGCTDDTADRARAYGDRCRLTVLEVEEASKIAALNAALAFTTRLPVVFLDADVVLNAEAVRKLCQALDGPALASSSALNVDLTEANCWSRSYHRFWEQLPSIASGLAGRGVYVLSGPALERLGTFPDVVADDRYVHLMFGPDERAVVPDAVSTVVAARTARDLIRRKSRVFAGNAALQLRPAGTHGAEPSWPAVIRSNPGALVDLPAYLAVNAVAKIKARRTNGWNRDESSRISSEMIEPRLGSGN